MGDSQKTFKELQTLYSENFSTGYIGHNINMKFALISLIGYLVHELQKIKPDVTYYQVIYKLAETTGCSESFIKALAVVVEDFSYGCEDFPTFGLTVPQMKEKIKQILNGYLPF